MALPCDAIHVLGVCAAAVGRCPYNSAQHIQNIPFQVYSLLGAILLFILPMYQSTGLEGHSMCM